MLKFNKLLDTNMSDDTILSAIDDETLIPVYGVPELFGVLLTEERYSVVIDLIEYSHRCYTLTEYYKIDCPSKWDKQLSIIIACVIGEYSMIDLDTLSTCDFGDIISVRNPVIRARLESLNKGEYPPTKQSFIFKKNDDTKVTLRSIIYNHDESMEFCTFLTDKFPKDYMEVFSLKNCLYDLAYDYVDCLFTEVFVKAVPDQFWETDLGRLINYKPGDDIGDFMYGEIKSQFTKFVDQNSFNIELYKYLYATQSSLYLTDERFNGDVPEIISLRKFIIPCDDLTNGKFGNKNAFVVKDTMSDNVKKWIVFHLTFVTPNRNITGLENIPSGLFTEVMEEYDYPIRSNYIADLI